MPKEYGDYGYWNKPYFLAKAAAVGPNTRQVIQRVIEKFDYPVQSFRSCFGILRFADKYSKEALERCCRDALLYGRCSYNYISNTVSTYATPNPGHESVDRMKSSLKPALDREITGAYKDDDAQYSLDNLLKRQSGGDVK